MNNVVLFDMDGTLTPPRKPLKENMLEALKNLSNYAKIGIVTGSGFDYIKEQCDLLFEELPRKTLKKITILPCNGTQVFELQDEGWKSTFSLDMRKHLGEHYFKQLMLALCQAQYMTSVSYNAQLTFSGHFISYRGSMINWCPIGRLASDNDRAMFIAFDKEAKLRENVLKSFEASSHMSEKLSFALGGSTSIDIYPHGWDKTHALNHFKDSHCWFVGDRCTDPNGNDKSIYDKVKNINSNAAFETKSTTQTIKIINKIIEQIKEE